MVEHDDLTAHCAPSYAQKLTWNGSSSSMSMSSIVDLTKNTRLGYFGKPDILDCLGSTQEIYSVQVI